MIGGKIISNLWSRKNIHNFSFRNYCLIILDRDGVINVSPTKQKRYIFNVAGLNLIKNTINLIVEAQLNGKFVCVATNQQGVGKGLISWSNLDKLHNKINKQIMAGGGKSIKFYVCPHLETDDCVCRKPKPGLILQALRDFNVEKKKVLFIGDQLSDELTAIAAGVDFYYINHRE